MDSEYSSGFLLCNNHPEPKPESSKKLPEPICFSEYIDLVETALLLNSDLFTQVCDTAVGIALPRIEKFAENPEVVEILQGVLPNVEHIKEWKRYYIYTGYLAFAIIEGKTVCELRVNYLMRKYLYALLNLADSGMIDYIKSETYKGRND